MKNPALKVHVVLTKREAAAIVNALRDVLDRRPNSNCGMPEMTAVWSLTEAIARAEERGK